MTATTNTLNPPLDAISFTVTDWASACEQLYALRRAVFVDELELSQPVELTQDDAEAQAQAWHITVTHESSPEQIIAAARLLPDGEISRVVVAANWRSQGLGRALLNQVLQLADEKGITEVTVAAHRQVINFYRKLGFQTLGEEYRVADLPHRNMRLTLAKWRQQTPAEHAVAGVAESLETALALIENARREVRIYTPYLHPHLYGTTELSAALGRRVSHQPRIQCRMILPKANEWRRNCAPLSELIERLSALQLRAWPSHEPRERAEFSQGFLLADQDAMLLHSDPPRCSGFYRRQNGIGADIKHLVSFFDDIWERSEPDVELRRLGI